MQERRNRNPGHALQRVTGVEEDYPGQNKPHTFYPICREIQSRRLRARFGFSARRADLVASLIFGEGVR